MQEKNSVISKNEFPNQENIEFSWKQAYLDSQRELENMKQKHEELTIKLIETQYDQEQSRLQVDMQQNYMLNVIADLEASKAESIDKNKMLEAFVAEVENKKAEVEMQQVYLMNVIEELETTKQEIVEKNEKLENTAQILNRAYTNIKDSVNYAKRIQEALLPKLNILEEWFEEYFIIFRPTDVVSGDFYWFTQVKNKVVVVVADCTGHGIPGAFMSILSIQSLHYIVNVEGVDDSDQIVNMLHENTRTLLRQHETNNMDGMDIALVILDMKHKILEFTGAHNPLILIQNGNFHHIPSDRFAVGGYQREGKREFTKRVFHVNKGDSFYIYSDGYQDMCGGLDGRRFMSQRFRRVLQEISPKKMIEQCKILKKIKKYWLRHEPKHLDDILVMGIRI